MSSAIIFALFLVLFLGIALYGLVKKITMIQMVGTWAAFFVLFTWVFYAATGPMPYINL